MSADRLGTTAAARATAMALAVVVADVATKAWAEQLPAEGVWITGRLGLSLTENHGLGFGLPVPSGLAVAVAAAVTVAVGWWLYRSCLSRSAPCWPVALLLGGALGNVLDRLNDRAVTDLMVLGPWPSFNVADAAITVGVAWLILGEVWPRSRASREATAKHGTLTVVTSNIGKATEISTITGWPVETVQLDVSEIQSLDLELVARRKALAAYRVIGKPVVVDDTGLSIAALNGLPGPFVAWFLERLGPRGILDTIKERGDRRAEVATCIGYADEHGVRTFLGTVSGSISTEPRGEGGFGYDSIFIPDGQGRTYAEMAPQEKGSISMRRLALEKLRSFLNERRG